MTTDPATTAPRPAHWRAIDRTCDRFEADWAAGARPRIEDYLSDGTDPTDPELLEELVRLEVHYRRRVGETPHPDDYRDRLPPLAPAWFDDGPAAAPAVPGYEVLDLLGRGGMGEVYRARDPRLKRLVALKLIRAGDRPAEASRFRREAEVVARLRHPNIVQIYEVGESGGRPYLALEYLPGGSLDRRLAGTPLPPRAAARLVEVLARAVQHAHEQGVVHRDLKPANVLLVEDHGDKPRGSLSEGEPRGLSPWAGVTPKVADFGLAKRLDAESALTQSGAILGTPSYMAPEQAGGAVVGPAADIYALGAILYECLTGRPPFKAASALDTLRQVVDEEPVSVRRLQPGLPRDLETVCQKCLNKEPHRRYASAAALADDLGRWLDGRPVAARPAGPVRQGWHWCRRHRAVAGLLAALAASLIAGATAATVFAVGADRSARQARQALAERDAMERELQAVRGQLVAWIKGQNSDLRRLPAEEFLTRFAREHPNLDPAVVRRAFLRPGEAGTGSAASAAHYVFGD